MSDIEPTEPIEPDKPFYVRKYGLSDYIQKPDVVKKANDDALDFIETLMDENEQLLDENENLLTELRAKDRYLLFVNKNIRIKWKTQLFQGICGVIALTLVGFGVNSATASPQSYVGWLLIGCGVVVELLALSLLLITRPQGGNQ